MIFTYSYMRRYKLLMCKKKSFLTYTKSEKMYRKMSGLYLQITICISKDPTRWLGHGDVASDVTLIRSFSSDDVTQSYTDTWHHMILTCGTIRCWHVTSHDADTWHHMMLTHSTTRYSHVVPPDDNTWHYQILTRGNFYGDTWQFFMVTHGIFLKNKF